MASIRFLQDIDIDGNVLVSQAGNAELTLLRTSGAELTLSSQSNLGTLTTTNNFPLHLGTNGGTRMALLTNGNVGVATTIPSYKFSVSGSMGTTNSGSVYIGGAIGDTVIGRLGNTSGVLNLEGDGTRSIRLGSATNGEVVRVDNTNGRLGIGTSSPSAKLDVNGKIKLGSQITASVDAAYLIGKSHTATGNNDPLIALMSSTATTNSLTIGGGSSVYNTATSISFNTSANTNTHTGTTAMFINGQGDVGFGTSSITNSTGYVRVSMNDTSGAILEQKVNNVASSRFITSPSLAELETIVSMPLSLGTNNTEAIRIDTSQNIGIGTSSPSAKLNIVGDASSVITEIEKSTGESLFKVQDLTNPVIISNHVGGWTTWVQNKLTTGTRSGLLLDAGSSSGDWNFYARSADTNTFYMGIRGDGNIGIGTSSPSAKTHIVGDSNTSGTTALLVENSSGDNTLEIRNNGTLLQNIVNAPSSIAIGLGALTSITTTFGRLVAVGYNALDANTSGYDNTAVGHSALTANTTGSFNTAIGKSALTVNTTGSHNTAVGVSSLDTNSTGNYNTALGKSALRLATSNYNTGVGYQAAEKTSTGTQNVALGAYSLFSNTSGSRNISIGSFSIEESISGSDNIAIGDRAGEKAVGSVSNTTPSTSIYIGNSVTPNANNEQNQIIIGHQGVGFGSNTATFGNSSITTTHLYGQLSLEDYGSGTYTGTAAYTLAVDASGNIIETSGGGGSTPTLQEVTTAGNTTTDDVGIQMSNPVSALHIGDGNNTISSALYSTDIVNVSAQNTAPGLNIISAGTSSFNRGVFKATRAKGSLASPSAPTSGDYVFSLLGAAYDGTSASPATAGIEMLIDGTVSPTAVPQRIEFQTSTGTSRSTRMTIKSDGDIGVNTTNPLAKLHLVGADTSVATDALLIENSGGSDLFKITNSGNFYMSSASRFASIVINNVDTVGTGNYSTIVGYQAGDGTNTNGLYLTAIGARAAQLTNGGTFSVAIGMNSARNAGSLSNAVVVGMNAVNNSGGFSNSVAVGRSAAEQSNLTTSTIVGYYAGRAMGTTQRSNNVYIGYNVASSSNNQSGNTFIGSNIQSSSTEALNNTVIIGSSSQERLRVSADGDVTWTGGNYMKIQTGTTASRPSSPVAGMIRFNTTTGKYEGYVDSITGWVNFH